MTTFKTAFEQIKLLVADFESNEQHFLSANYSEAEVRKDFIDKFFVALGWDINHEEQKNPFQQEVKVEAAQKQADAIVQRRADYAFALAPDYKQTRFFVEAKKPSRSIFQNKEDYFQTAKYGWNAGTGVSILTNFREFIVIDCRYKPDIETITNNGIERFSYKDYLNEAKFAKIYWLFSHEAVNAKNLINFIEDLPKPKGKEKQLNLFGGNFQRIDESFLEYIDIIRLKMAQAFYQNNKKLDKYELTEATQRTIDRIVFMRFLEDKQIETEELTYNIAVSQHSWQKFIETSKRLDAKYNGIVFKKYFIDNKDFLGANDTLFRDITFELNHKNTPYDFNYVPIHILGSIYECFLGRIITIENEIASIEQKPSVRKAGGVFYTPKYIVDYIVKNTVDKKIEGKTPAEIAKMHFADIACGSGSFLIGVFDSLLNYHKNYYNENPDKAEKDGCKYSNENNIWVLTIKQKQKILQNNIFGIDIDFQATEVTQLSLFLKFLEDETMTTANDMQVMFSEKILPDLSENIKCGNSLIEMDFPNVLNFDKDDLYEINPFNFKRNFEKVFNQSGFDVILGNPPYIFTRNQGFRKDEKDYYYSHYKLQKYQLNTYTIFIERGYELLKQNGFLGYIIPNNWLTINTLKHFRDFIIKNTGNTHIVNNLHKVFKEVSVDTSILIFEKQQPDTVTLIESPKENEYIEVVKRNFAEILEEPIIQIKQIGENNKIIKKINQNSQPLSKLATVSTGLKAYQKGKGKPVQTEKEKANRIFHSLDKKDKTYGKYLQGADVKRYEINWSGEYLSYGDWLAEPRKSVPFKGARILVRQIPSDFPYMINAAYTENAFYNDINSMVVFTKDKTKLKFLLGIINSKLVSFWFNKVFDKMQRGIFPQFKVNELAMFPMPIITKENKQLYNKVIENVEQIFNVKEKLKTVLTYSREYDYIINFIKDFEYEIDKLVYQLYNLSAEEIEIIENP
ncbi:MAG: Eco57I restriction-modification methylase domain-containing protein [Prevotellaceae bacterium]|jgi:adenine-specific DNA-methyltransferase|nr:Eco57I restriction-modification methylase domain-containing protein [Prevotellaceae bacterium]